LTFRERERRGKGQGGREDLRPGWGRAGVPELRLYNP